MTTCPGLMRVSPPSRISETSPCNRQMTSIECVSCIAEARLWSMIWRSPSNMAKTARAVEDARRAPNLMLLADALRQLADYFEHLDQCGEVGR